MLGSSWLIILLNFYCVVVRLEGKTPTKYGLLLNNDDRYKDVKRELSKYCGLVCSQVLLVEIFGASVKVGRMKHCFGYFPVDPEIAPFCVLLLNLPVRRLKLLFAEFFISWNLQYLFFFFLRILAVFTQPSPRRGLVQLTCVRILLFFYPGHPKFNKFKISKFYCSWFLFYTLKIKVILCLSFGWDHYWTV